MTSNDDHLGAILREIRQPSVTKLENYLYKIPLKSPVVYNLNYTTMLVFAALHREPVPDVVQGVPWDPDAMCAGYSQGASGTSGVHRPVCHTQEGCRSVTVHWHFANPVTCWALLTHWGRVTHMCICKLTIIGSDNGLSPGWCQAIIWTSAEILLIGSLGTNFCEILIEIYIFSVKKMHLKMLSGK